MSGHSKWSTIKRAKGANDVKKGAAFTKLSNAITIAVRQGGAVGDPNFNFKLRLAIDKARGANMPKDNIERAIDKGLGVGEEIVLNQATFEGFGPAGIAVIVETISDNNTRTSNQLRSLFSKLGGNLGSPGSVSYMFNRTGEIIIGKEGLTLDKLMEKVMETEGEDVEEESEFYVYTKPEDLHKVKDKLAASGLSIKNAEIVYKANKDTILNIQDPDLLNKVQDFLSEIDELDDVQNVYSNAEFS